MWRIAKKSSKGRSTNVDDRSATACPKRRCSPHNEPRTARQRHFRPETAPLASGSLPHSVQAVQHDALYPRATKPRLPCQPGTRIRRQPASTRTTLGRQLWIPAAKMSECTRRACVLFRWTARLEQTSACAPWHSWPETVSSLFKNSFFL